MKLKKIFLYSATMLLLVSCANEDKQGSSGYGAINVQVSADYKVVPVTRSTAESASTIENPDVSEFALKLCCRSILRVDVCAVFLCCRCVGVS